MSTTASAVSALLLAATVAAAAGIDEPLTPLRDGELSSAWLESTHPYDGATPERLTLHHPGATYLAVHFARLDLAPGDAVVVRDPAGRRLHRYQGQGLSDVVPGFWSLSVPGDTAWIELVVRASSRGGWGFAVDGYEHGFRPLVEESICSNDDKQDAVCYQTSHPEYWDAAQAVGRVRHCGGLCTGSLVSCDNHFLTNEHCKGSCGVTNLEIDFNYQRPSCGSGSPSEVVFQGLTDVATDVTLDYWLTTLDGDPVAQYGYLKLDPRPLVQDEEIYIPQHPGGVPKQLGIESDRNAGGVCRVDEPNRDGRGPDTDAGYYCDTEGGSSGSPVLSAVSHQVVALHHFGGCLNAGVRIENIGPQVDTILPGCSFCAAPPAPALPSVVATAPNEITVDWTPLAMATSYRVFRGQGDCTAPQVLVAEVVGPPWIDTDVSGGLDYSYTVQQVVDDCASSRSACATATATGACTLAPDFAGLTAAQSGDPSTCQIELAWNDGVGTCSTDLVYNVYRSTTAAFTPAPGNLRASCVAASPWADTNVAAGVRYYYKVRAEDRMAVGSGPCAGGAEDANLIERSARAVLGTPLGELFDGAEAAPLLTLEAPWEVSTADARTGLASFRAPADDELVCAALQTEPIVVSAASVLSYATRVEDLEATATEAADGGTVELSTDEGATWTQLTPAPDYTHSLFASLGCNLAAGTRVYSRNLGWTDASVSLAPWAGQAVSVRFLLATDGADRIRDSVAWWIDDVRITEVANQECGNVTQPPGEVSGLGASRPFLLAKRPGGGIYFAFEELGDALGYNLYQGDLRTFYNHGDVPFACDAATAAAAPGQLETTLPAGSGSHYYLVTAWNGDPTNGDEGPSGPGLPPAENSCPPSNDH